MLNKADILNASKLRHRDIEVAEWGGTVRIQEMTAGAYDRYQQSLYKQKGGKYVQDLTDMVASYVSCSLVDEKGRLMFTLDEIKGLPAKPISMLYNEAQALNGEGEDGQEEISKNSEGGREG